VTTSEALGDFVRSTPGALLFGLLFLEILRQIHYFVSERSSAYHGFWQGTFFGGWERRASKFNPWTRFRVARFVRWWIYLTIYAFIVDYFVPDISSPLQAITDTPRLLVAAIPFLIQIVVILTIAIGQFVAIFWFLSRGGMDVIMPEEIKTRFSHVWGQDHVLRLIKENIAFLERPDEIEAKGGYIPGGILLWGPPGTGKTLIAEAVAGETGRPYVFLEPGAFINMFFGVGILKVKSLYRKLRKLSLRHGGVIVFFDEADSLGSRGGGIAGATPHPAMACNGLSYLSAHGRRVVIESYADERQNEQPVDKRRKIIMGGMGGGGMGTLQALLTEMNGLTKPRGLGNRIRKLLGFRPKPPPKYRILHIMATNMPNALDPALLRPGRIDRTYRVGYPSKEGRLATFQGYLAKVKHNLTEEEMDRLATRTPYYTGASIKDLVNESLIHAIRDGREIVEWDDIWHAKVLKELGPAEDREYIEREKMAVAVHEASHAVAQHLLRPHESIDIVTIERRGEIGGLVSPIPVEDRFVQWRSEYQTDVMVSLASLAGERIFFGGDNSAGVGGDMGSASRMAGAMEGAWAMGKRLTALGNVHFDMSGRSIPVSAATIRARPEEVEAILQELYEEVYKLLEGHQEQVLAVAARVVEKKTISGDEVAEIMNTPPGELAKLRPKNWTLAPIEKLLADANGGRTPLAEEEDEPEQAPAPAGVAADAKESSPES
jgi:ATP-dependent Zn protease